MKPCKITVDLYNTFRERMPEYVQYDRNVPLEITVLEDGKPADLNGLFGRLLVSKPDGHEVYSNDVEINGNVITTILREQIFTASGVAQVTVDILDEQNSKRALIPFGIRIRSAVITDESIKSSNDYQTITALISDVRALDAIFHVEQEQRAEAFNAQMQSQEATFTEAQCQFLADHREAMFHVEQQMTEQADMFHVEQTERAEAFEQSEADREQRFEAQITEWAQTVEQAEATRQFNEERRQSAENKRESAEKARESAERQRVDTEAVRQRQEQERGQGEAGRATAEANRVKAEQTRVDNESSRESAESSRVDAESQRATAESHRVTAETSRANAESQRATAETNRAGAEGRRSEAESNRVTAENNRTTAESNRVTAENTRETQENARREAEEDRATRMAQWEAKAEETAQKAQEAVDSAQAFVNTNEERLLTDRDKIDYMGNQHESLKAKNDSDVDWLLGEINTVHYDGQHITATDTIEGRSKSAILKGQTLVNLIPSNTITINGGESNWRGYGYLSHTLESGGKYLIKAQIVENTINHENGLTMLFRQISSEGSTQYVPMGGLIRNGYMVVTIDSDKPSVDYISIYANTNATSGSATIKELLVIEYQDGMENWDIPYFEGMQSVKMPVLTTTGKNLIIPFTSMKQSAANGVTISENEIIGIPTNKGFGLTQDIYLEKDITYTLSFEIRDGLSNRVRIKDGNSLVVVNIKDSFTVPETKMYTIIFENNDNTKNELHFKCPQLEYNSTATSYEPYKSNILTVNKDVTLRGIGEVQDTLDLISGEVTERIGEIVMDGAQDGAYDYVPDESLGLLTLRLPKILDIKNDGINLYGLLSDKYSSVTNKSPNNIYSYNGRIMITKELSELESFNTSDKIKLFLSQNPITLQYPLAEKSIKTVDLSDNHVYSYKDVTHYDCSSAEGSLVPTLSIDVPTNLPAVVARQRATTQELEKKNQELAHAVTIVDEHREEGDLELLSSDFDFELRLMEIEFAIGIPMMANYKGVRNMARTPYDMAKALILGGKYEREEMIAKLDRFEKLGSITADQKAELIALMDAIELTQ